MHKGKSKQSPPVTKQKKHKWDKQIIKISKSRYNEPTNKPKIKDNVSEEMQFTIAKEFQPRHRVVHSIIWEIGYTS